MTHRGGLGWRKRSASIVRQGTARAGSRPCPSAFSCRLCHSLRRCAAPCICVCDAYKRTRQLPRRVFEREKCLTHVYHVRACCCALQITLALWDHDTVGSDDYCSQAQLSLDSPDVVVINYRCAPLR